MNNLECCPFPESVPFKPWNIFYPVPWMKSKKSLGPSGLELPKKTALPKYTTIAPFPELLPFSSNH
jgi:hypothetical protein